MSYSISSAYMRSLQEEEGVVRPEGVHAGPHGVRLHEEVRVYLLVHLRAKNVILLTFTLTKLSTLKC